MSDLITQLKQRLQTAIADAIDPQWQDTDPLLRSAQDPKFGDFQANVAMSLAKQVKRKPRDVAEAIAANLTTDPMFEQVEVAGPGFINLTLTADALATAVKTMHQDTRLGIAPPANPQTIVVDYSSPNVAKQMHVGHLRSTIIGDAIARVLTCLGHNVIRQNHVGDWGTQFGMLIEHLLDHDFDPATGDVGELTQLYQASKKRFDDEPDFNERARQRVVSLQAGDDASRETWKALVEASKRYFQTIYARLDVQLTMEDICGESFYNDRLPAIVEKLMRQSLAVEDQGAIVVYPEGFQDRDGNPLGMIIRKSDGGYLYATTDLAAAMYRVEELHADRVIYVIGVPQRQHFDMFSAALRKAGWISDDVRLDFVGFGSVLGKDRKMFKTRSGDTVRLVDLIDEAEQRAKAIVAEKNPDMPEEQQSTVAHAVGIGALKYADLSGDRIKDYIFDFDRMLAMEGNTAPYVQNAYVRVRSIFRKLDAMPDAQAMADSIAIVEPAERTLALKLLQYPSIVTSVGESLEPHRLCTYLYELAVALHSFYENCSVLRAGDEATMLSRLAISDLTARTLAAGLDLLGIQTVEQM